MDIYEDNNLIKIKENDSDTNNLDLSIYESLAFNMGRIRHIAKKFWLKDITQFEKGLVPLETYLDYDEEGRVVLAVNPTELYEPMNGKKASELNRDIFCYLDEKSDVIPLRYTLNIRFTGTYTEEQKQQITTLMKQHYQECYLSKRNELKFNALKSCRTQHLSAPHQSVPQWKSNDGSHHH